MDTEFRVRSNLYRGFVLVDASFFVGTTLKVIWTSTMSPRRNTTGRIGEYLEKYHTVLVSNIHESNRPNRYSLDFARFGVVCLEVFYLVFLQMNETFARGLGQNLSGINVIGKSEHRL
jgi:hypothetical protein